MYILNNTSLKQTLDYNLYIFFKCLILPKPFDITKWL